MSDEADNISGSESLKEGMKWQSARPNTWESEWMRGRVEFGWISDWVTTNKRRLDEGKWVGERLINKWNCEQMRTRDKSGGQVSGH
jgi:hypothetical protein